MGLFRNFADGSYQLQVRLEAFNLSNTPHFANPDNDANGSTGRIFDERRRPSRGRGSSASASVPGAKPRPTGITANQKPDRRVGFQFKVLASFRVMRAGHQLVAARIPQRRQPTPRSNFELS
jgi:hypothetical protein